MAGDKGKGKKRFSSSVQEHRGGEERGPKIRKVAQEEMKRKGKLQIMNRDKPAEVEKMRRLEEKGKNVVPEDAAAAAADYASRMTEKKVAFYKKVVEQDYGYLYFTEEEAACLPGAIAEGMAVNDAIRKEVKDFKEYASRCLDEYEAKGFLECYPPDGKLPHDFLNRLCAVTEPRYIGPVWEWLRGAPRLPNGISGESQ